MKGMHPFLTLTFVFFVFWQNSNAQTCQLSISNFPAVQGLRLGMTVEDLENIVGAPISLKNSEETIYKSADGSASRSYSKEELGKVDIGAKYYYYSAAGGGNPNFEGISSIGIKFYKDVAISIAIWYLNKGSVWTSAKEFSYLLSDRLNIPKSIWVSRDNTLTWIECNDFRAHVFLVTEPSFYLHNPVTEREIDELALKRYQNTPKTTEKAAVSPYLNDIKVNTVRNDAPQKPQINLLNETCPTGLGKIPFVRKLRLGMSRDAIPSSTYPGCSFSDLSNCFYRVENIRDRDVAKGIDAIQIEIDTITGTVASITVIYDDSIRWNSVKEFADIISKSLQILPEKWTPVKKLNKVEKLRYACANYEIEVSMADELRPQLVISKTTQLIKFQRNLIQQEKKKEFKP